LSQVDLILKENPYVDTYSRRTGAGLGGDFKEAYQGDYFVKLIDPSRRPAIGAVMDDIIHEITIKVPGVAMDPKQLMGDMIGDMVGRPQPIVVQLSAKNPDVLDQIAPNVAGAIAKVPGVEPASVNSGVVPAGDALEIHVDPAAAASQGITPDEVRTQVYHYLNGAVVTKYLGQVQDIGIRLWLNPLSEKLYRDQLGQMLIHASNGRVFPLKQVAEVAFVAGQPQITRNNLAQVVPVTAELRSGHDLGSTVAAVRKALQKPGVLSNEVYYSIGGQYKQQQMAAAGMIKVFVAAAIGEFILLLFLYQRFLLPIVIIVSAMVSSSAVFIGLWLTGIELNITAMMGMVMIIGIGTEMAIFFASEYQELEKTMSQREALRAAALNRLRPIMMSTLAMVLALLPLGAAISGSGDQMLQPLAIAIISGIVVQLPLVLLAVPVVLGLAHRRYPLPPHDVRGA
jgi:multidrug efflux pump subunit AcrB